MIRVASYNIHKAVGSDRRRRPDRILEVLHELDADVVALQEADRRFGTRAGVLTPLLEEHGWHAAPVALRAASTGWHGNAILVRTDATVTACDQIHLPALEPRGAVLADLRIKGVPMRMVGMHLDLSGLWRRKQAHAILAHCSTSSTPLPTVMAGDLNEWSAASGCLRDFARDMRFAETGRSFHARRPIARLDRIMVSPEWQVLGAGVHDSAMARTASDHLPVWAEIAPA